ncbi:neuraminidase-like domain-containing protein [Halomonas cerina]|uniref:5-hydroxyisourate hydrolase-like protein (Transthyretin family) n=1 Tax=Halomonas cerina TaxID=447424 RepID=A0A839V8A1_9GAMM|nr:neuraminidase-like domain-containing protein [Halomonas cerina]MBB3188947.1 5-hydroxyisourate hydrolase-like protein (transthyretin family) [Halomonas cerina]
MNLQGRNLSRGMQGEDVQLLQSELQKLDFTIAVNETDAGFFGEATTLVVMAFQTQHELEATGIVDERTAQAINAAVDAEQPERFVVNGQVQQRDGTPEPGVLVRAVDRDLRREQELGQTLTNESGRYEIAYTAGQFRRADKGNADLVVRVFDAEGRELAASETIFHAPPVAEVDLVVAAREEPEPSEYERLLAGLSPVLEGVQPAELIGADVDFLAKETGLEWQRIEILVEAFLLAPDTRLPAEAFYGWGRLGFSLKLETLLDQEPEALRTALEKAIDENIIPARLRESLGAIMDLLEQLRLERGFLVVHEMVGRLLAEETEEPLSGFTLHAFDLGAGPEPRDLGHEATDGNGLFTLLYFAPRREPSEEEEEEGEEGRRLHLHIIARDGTEIAETDLSVPQEQEEVIEVRVAVPEEEEPSPTVSELAEALSMELPEGLQATLIDHGIRTLADIRREGGIGHLEGVDPADPAVPVVEAHARLGALSTNTEANTALIDAGYDDVPAVGRATRVNVVDTAREALGDFGAARLPVEARAQKQFLDNVIASYRADRANGLTAPSSDIDPDGALAVLFPDTCHCRDCDAAVSPLAYLAELLDYAVTHLKREDGQGDEVEVTLEDLTERFHQPFGDLPTACEEVERKVRQVRICIEVLRRYLAAAGLPPSESPQETALAEAQREYHREAYMALLTRLGTSFEELRLAQTTGAEARDTVANRLGIPPDALDRLLLNPKAAPTDPDAVTEEALERLFGLVDTTRDPLSEGIKRGDETEQIGRWNLDGVVWSRHTAPDGTVYISLTGAPAANVVRVELFRDQDRTQLVASGERTTATGPVAVAAVDGSALSGRFEIDFITATETIEIVAVPHFLSARLQYLRTLWREQDWPADPYRDAAEAPLPIIDPDIIGPDDLRKPIAGNAAFDLWRKRREWVDERVNELVALTKTVADEEGNDVEVPDVTALFDRMYQTVTYDTTDVTPWADTTPPADFSTLRDNLAGGNKGEVEMATEQLDEDLRLTVEAFNQLLAIRDKAAAWETDPQREPVTDDEWRAFFSILVQAQKRAFYPTWIDEEKDQDVELDPKRFWISLREPQLPLWRASAEARAAWQRALRQRGQTPHLDPDLVRPDDLRDPLSGATTELWQERRNFIELQLNVLRAEREAAATALAGFDENFDDTIGVPALELDTLAERREEGEEIVNRLEQLDLTTEAFDYLLRIRRLTEEEVPILDDEWKSVDAILVQVKKRREYAIWRIQERQRGITLGPDHFKIPEPPPLQFPPPEPEPLPEWRATSTARRAWEETLQSRIDQEQGVIEALDEAVSATEEAVLPRLRDALVRVSDAAGNTLEAKAKALTDELLIDARADACQMTTRPAQASTTLQLLLWSLRTGQLQDTHPDLLLDADDFDEAWEWLGSYQTWRSAMLVFLYPENILLPSLRKWQTPAFRELVKETRTNTRLTPENACEAATTYADYFRDVCQLSLEASVVARTDAFEGDCRTKSFEGDRHLVYLFATGGITKSVYYSRYDPKDDTPHAQSLWTPVPGIEPESEAIGAAAYAINNEERYVYLFVRVQDAGEHKLIYTRFDLTKDEWTGETTELEPPEDATNFSAAVKQRHREDEPPHLAIFVSDGAIYARKLNRAGTAWQDGEWYPLVGRPKAREFSELHAMIEPALKEYYLIVRGGDNQLFYRLFGERDDGKWRELSPVFHTYLGGFPWPGTDHVYAFMRQGEGPLTRYVSLQRSSSVFAVGLESYDAFDEFDDSWLKPVTGLSLSGFVIEGEDFDGMNLLVFFVEEARDHKEKAKGIIESLAGKINNQSDEPGWKDWKLVDETIQRFSFGIDLTLEGALKRLLEGNLASFKSRRDSQEKIGPIIDFRGLNRIVIGAGKAPVDLPSRVTYHQTTGTRGRVILESDTVAFALPPGSRDLVVHPDFRPPRVVFVRSEFVQESDSSLTPTAPIPVAPFVTEPFEITEQLSSDELQVRRHQIADAFEKNTDAPASVLTYLEEAYYFVPMHLALQLQQRSHYTAALDWFRTVYDYSVSIARRKISYYLKQEESLAAGFERAEEWWLDPLNPHGIARTRANTYTRFTLLSLVRCLQAFADAEFTRDTAESLPRARTLYMTALELLDLPVLNQELNGCDELIGTLDIDLDAEDEAEAPRLVVAWAELKASLRRIDDEETLQETIGKVREILGAGEALATRLAKARDAVAEARVTQALSPTLAQAIQTKNTTTGRAHALLLRQPVVAKAVTAHSSAAGKDFGRAVADVTGKRVATLETGEVALPWLRFREEALATGGGAAVSEEGDDDTSVLTARRVIETPALTRMARIEPLHAVETARRFAPSYVPTITYRFCIPPNPILSSLRLGADLNLYKIRTCRNITGDERRLEPYAAPSDAERGLPTIGPGGDLALPGTITLQPTPYRYEVLIDRARRLVGLAQQIEAAFLSTLEKRDAEYYQRLKARQEISLTRAGVRLQDLRVKEAQDGVKLAELQRGRAEIRVDHFQGLLDEGFLEVEQAAIGFMINAAAFHATAAAGSIFSDINPFKSAAQAASSLAAVSSTTASILQIYASHERRKEEWRLQRDLARQDIRIGSQQILLTQDRVRVVGQERRIAELQADHAEETTDFLATKFTNADLYGWMSGVLEGVYRFFLQQATSMAQLAENQLAFQRQELPPSLIQADYWEAPLGLEARSADESGPDRRGLTGSARLLRDVEKLDLYAFETDERKLQLTKTFSLARLAPAEFQRFRETGVLRFNTSQELFNHDFPGHYLRLIKRVRTSVIALIPPTDGIKATLSTTGLSRVVIAGDGLFREVRVNRPPESVALSSPSNATGLFELAPQTSEKRFPFESLGVDTAWELQLPRAANQFDFSTIADVLLTIEYTALNSFAYRQRVIRELDDTLSADRPFSFRQEFADPFYDLHNPEQSDTPMVVRFETRRENFPANIDELRIQQVVLFFARAKGASFEVPVTHLHFIEQGSAGPAGGGATSIDGVLSTRRGNASSWAAMIGKSPFGKWELALPDTEEMRNRFKHEQIENILFVVTYSARTPAWPA